MVVYKKFFGKVGLLLLLTTLLSLFYLWHYVNSTNHIVINNDVHILACGDSHVKCAINDRQTKGVKNICKSSQAYLYTYAVLKKIIDNNPHIDTVILGYSFHSITDVFEENLKRRTIKNDYPDYLPILDRPSLSYLLKVNNIGVIRLFPNVINNSFVNSTLTDGTYPFIGEYYNSRKSRLDHFLEKKGHNKQFWKKDSLRSLSTIQFIYLKKIIDYCKNKHVKLILINTPVHPEYKKQVPDFFQKAYYGFYYENMSTVSLIDLHDMQLPKEYYGDGHHVNRYGATVVTHTLDSILGRKN